ncbi:hypothetical protein SAMN04489859_103017 [Paracoccus alcaliphilus]|uniref:Uncharacterized protein n=1 Tax=Paracoccus alcaliphilus TaxID=34002 RepID=A0A1H8LEV4_9RHOB|nr:hypothetical protein [Paracoccus alcaliphilus]SEO03665.1 hypothetical protein SAMN04489859_103017 [Paracoccus alcaliphilus]
MEVQRDHWQAKGALPAPSGFARHLAVPVTMITLLAISACSRPPTDDILPGGIPARTNLHQASTLPPDSVRTVARRDFGWRLIYHPTRAPVNAEQGAAFALCGLERKRPARIEIQPRIDPTADPGARMIDIYCS